MYGEPHCLCKMKSLGLPLNEPARKLESERAQKQWEDFMNSEMGKKFRKGTI
jgi:hypothetical protein